MPLLAAGAMYGSMAMVMQPKMLRSIVENTKQNAFLKQKVHKLILVWVRVKHWRYLIVIYLNLGRWNDGIY